jgi:hypothetical protein
MTKTVSFDGKTAKITGNGVKIEDSKGNTQTKLDNEVLELIFTQYLENKHGY